MRETGSGIGGMLGCIGTGGDVEAGDLLRLRSWAAAAAVLLGCAPGLQLRSLGVGCWRRAGAPMT